MATAVPAVYSPVAEAERAARLSAASGLLAEPGRYMQLVGLRRDWALAAGQLDAVSRFLLCEGWTQGEARTVEGWCLLGALVEVARDGSVCTAHDLLDLLVEVRAGRVSVPDWNDAVGRTFAEVLELVEDAALFARGFGAVRS